MRIWRLAAAAALTIGMCSAGTFFTGAVVFESGSGTAGSCTVLANCDFWNTVGGDFAYNLYLEQGSSFITTGNGAGTSPDIALTPGTYTYGIFGDGNGRFSNLGLNLYFDGSATPEISALGTVATTTTAPAFSANGAASTVSLSDGFQPGANSLSFIDGSLTITLTSFYWDTPSVQNLDKVSPFAVASNAIDDSVGLITLTVTSSASGVPEPSTLILGCAGLALLAWRLRRRAAFQA